MPATIRNSSNGWGITSDAEPIDWRPLEGWGPGEPLMLQVWDEPGAEIVEASIIGIEFPAFTDGRGLSLAVLLRTRLGFTGQLRATGAVHEDLLHYMVRCGFDAFELPDERCQATALSMLTPYTEHYQASVSNPDPAFRRVIRGAGA